MTRAMWSALSDQDLLHQCDVDTYRASGPGGQKRNKTSSAVRLRHGPSGIRVIAEESRSQHENKARALKRLRHAIFLQLRDVWPPGRLCSEVVQLEPLWRETIGRDGKLHLGRKDPRFWPMVGLTLDLLEATEARVSETAQLLAISTANLVDFFSVEPSVWAVVNQIRIRFGIRALRND